MVEKIIIEIEQRMAGFLNNMQMEELHNVLAHSLYELTLLNYGQVDLEKQKEELDFIKIFICSKSVEGCLEKSINLKCNEA